MHIVRRGGEWIMERNSYTFVLAMAVVWMSKFANMTASLFAIGLTSNVKLTSIFIHLLLTLQT